MSTVDWNEGAHPGFDVHSWDSEWASIAEETDVDPDAALSQFADLVDRMLRASGYAIDDPVARRGEELEIVASYRAARDTAERAEVGAAPRREVEQAIEDLRAVFTALAGELHSAET